MSMDITIDDIMEGFIMIFVTALFAILFIALGVSLIGLFMAIYAFWIQGSNEQQFALITLTITFIIMFIAVYRLFVKPAFNW